MLSRASRNALVVSLLVVALGLWLGVSAPEGASASAVAASPEVTSVLRAKIGLLPEAGGVSLDLVLLALIGAGYGMWKLNLPRSGAASTGPSGVVVSKAGPHSIASQTDSPTGSSPH
jgi:hypothetical protein